MVCNTRDRNIDSSRREDSRKGQVDRCEVIFVHPHKKPYPTDKNFNVVDVQLIDRPRIGGKAPIVKFIKLNSLLRYHGRFQGEPWNPRIGDMIYIYWLNEREALVLGQCASVEQEPVCRSEADEKDQEYVFKLCPWEEPRRNEDGNFVEFPLPKHPECFKWWPKTRDVIWAHDCVLGHTRPQCDLCTCLDDHTSGTWLKLFSDISPTQLDKPQRVKFHHVSGSISLWDEDGTIYHENRVQEDPRGHIRFDPTGTIDVHSEQPDDDGSMLRVVANEDNISDDHGPIAAELTHLPTMATVRIYKNGCIRIRAGGSTNTSEIFLGNNGNCWLWDMTHDNYIEFKTSGECEIKSNHVTIIGDVTITGDATIEGTLYGGE